MKIPTHLLTPMVVYPNHHRDLWADLDENGIKEPLEVVVLTFDEWLELSKPAAGCRRVQPGRFPALCVKVGNQRLAWARSKSIETVEVVAYEPAE